jgi:hypothetical protein
MVAHTYRVLIPNGLTFLSLLCGTGSILLSAATPATADAPRYLWVAGLLILASYLIDWCDGMVARLLHASTAFGLQLDSLVDMVSLGLAPTVLLFMYSLRVIEISPWLSGPMVVLVPLAGAFRLALFNLLPLRREIPFEIVSPQLSQPGGPEALAPGKPLRRSPHLSPSACPSRPLPHSVVLRAVAACWRRPNRRQRAAAAGGGGRRQ